MSINDKIRKLIYERYGNKDNGEIIAYDGLVCEEEFIGLTFLLKEAVKEQIEKGEDYKKEDGFFDLVATARQEALKQREFDFNNLKHWRELCYWVSAFYGEIFNDILENKVKCGYNLAKVSIVNIKKIAGESTTHPKVLKETMNNNAEKSLLKAELKLLQTTEKKLIVMCGGTFDYAYRLYNEEKPEICRLNCGTRCFNVNGVIFIEFIHPSSRICDMAKYAYAKEIFKEIRAENLI